jgi:hypothetical protein
MVLPATAFSHRSLLRHDTTPYGSCARGIANGPAEGEYEEVSETSCSM